MKKITIALLLVLTACTFAFAEEEPPVTYSDIDFTFRPTMTWYDSMGQSGLAKTERLDSFFTNPASIQGKGLRLDSPSLSVTMYNLEKLVSDPEAVDLFNKLIKGDASSEETTKFFVKLLDNLGSGHNLAAKADLGVSARIGSFGFGTAVQIKLHSLNSGSNITSQSLIPEINITPTLGFGYRILDTDALSLSAGVSLHGVFKAYYKGISAGKIVSLISSGEDLGTTLMWGTPIMGGWALPFDLGVTLGLFNDTFTIAATANNINGIYHMKSYTGIGYMLNKEAPEDAPEKKDSVAFDVKTPWSLNFGVAFAPELGFFKPVVTLDLIDMFGLFKSFGSETFRASDLLLHMNFGAEVGLTDFIQLRAGVNRGFLSIGTGIWLKFAQLDVSYGWQEFGAELGDKPVDALTIRFILGYDKK
ncbi:MAG: hypothetical protein IKP61_06195 [Spirochaetales bacterium]|nr:hypothetical protein [Spirochaetales bacterium]